MLFFFPKTNRRRGLIGHQRSNLLLKGFWSRQTAMPIRQANDWPYLRRKALEQAEALAVWSNWGRLPTSVGRIAGKRLVKEIRFRPLLSEGTISIEEDGFAIAVG